MDKNKKSESEIGTIIDQYIEGKLKKKIICSNFDIEDLVDEKDYEEEELNDKINQLLQERKIYKFGNMQSYLETVRDVGYISLMEKHMMRAMEENKHRKHKVLFRDLEFPIDGQGRYDFNNIDKKEFYLIGEEKFYAEKI